MPETSLPCAQSDFRQARVPHVRLAGPTRHTFLIAPHACGLISPKSLLFPFAGLPAASRQTAECQLHHIAASTVHFHCARFHASLIGSLCQLPLLCAGVRWDAAPPGEGGSLVSPGRRLRSGCSALCSRMKPPRPPPRGTDFLCPLPRRARRGPFQGVPRGNPGWGVFLETKPTEERGPLRPQPEPSHSRWYGFGLEPFVKMTTTRSPGRVSW